MYRSRTFRKERSDIVFFTLEYQNAITFFLPVTPFSDVLNDSKEEISYERGDELCLHRTIYSLLYAKGLES